MVNRSWKWTAAWAALLVGCAATPSFEQVRAAPEGVRQGTHASLVLDGDDQPMLAWVDEATGGAHALRFSRYDAAKGAWTAPVTVADGLGEVEYNVGFHQVSLGRDASTGKLGVAFLKNEQFCAGANTEDTVHVSFSTDNGATWTASERVSDSHYTRNDPVDGVEVCGTTAPRIALHGGKVHVAWGADAGEIKDPLDFYRGYYHAVSSGNGWTRTLLPRVGSEGANGVGILDLAVDPSGTPAVAYVMQNLTGYTRAVGFVRPGTGTVPVTDSGGIQNDTPRLALAFEGTKPRVATFLTRAADAPYRHELFESDDGLAFTRRALPTDAEDNGMLYLDLAYGGGKGLLTYDFTTNAANAPGACGGPKWVRAEGTTWTACGADRATRQMIGNYVTAALTREGKALVAFFTSRPDEASPARFGPGLVLYREH